ncbi:MAG TPA: molybdenum cofactor biosynthesis protein MoaE [Solirubrobacterales bacterium]|nr:molybdenum cofactor biosynthesis protein MoaE [Solirubrobacterales bacterium]
MTVSVRLFAILRERAGRDSVEIELPEGATVGDAFARLAETPGLGELVARMPLRMAVNREYAGEGARIVAGDELAVIPPISGGAEDEPVVIGSPEGDQGLRVGARTHASVTDEPLSAERLSTWVGDPGAGAIVTFQGVTREVASLDYEAYREMAEERIAAILVDCVERHGLLAAAAEHRVGRVPRGEPGVVVAVSAGHRGEAFEGAREAIDRIKAEAPIWKRELDGAGEGAWVEGAAAPEAG